MNLGDPGTEPYGKISEVRKDSVFIHTQEARNQDMNHRETWVPYRQKRKHRLELNVQEDAGNTISDS